MPQDNIIVLATGILINNKGQILLLRRSNINGSYKGCWQFPEGKIEFGEQSEEALKREIKEEANLNINLAKLLFISASLMYAKGQDYHVIRIVYKVDWNGVIQLDKEHDSFKWFRISDSKLYHPAIDGLSEVMEKL